MIIKEYEEGVGGGGSVVFSTPKRKYRESRKEVVVDSFDWEAIRGKIYGLYEKKRMLQLNGSVQKWPNPHAYEKLFYCIILLN